MTERQTAYRLELWMQKFRIMIVFLVCCGVLAGQATAATLAHRWSFNGSLADSVGGRTAQVVNVGGNDAVLSSGAITLAGGDRNQSDYVSLGAGLLSGYPSATLELWATPYSVQNWGRIFDAGSGTGEFLMMSWSRGTTAGQDRVEWKDATTSTRDDTNAPYALGVEYHIVMVIEGGAGALGWTRVTWYASPSLLDNLGPARGSFETPNTPAALNDVSFWLGRSFWSGDYTANAAYNDVRIWDGALSSGQLEVLHDLGPDVVVDDPQEPQEQSSTLGVRQMERLNRGLTAIRTSSSQVYLGWRLLGTEWGQDIGFHIYRGQTRITTTPITESTNYVDTTTVNSTYRVSAVIDGVEQPACEPTAVQTQPYLEIPMIVPQGGITPDGVEYTYSPNDCSVGDLDGDGGYEVVVKWYPSNAQDNANAGYTGNVYLDAYGLDGAPMWRVDLGRNIRAGAHYTQFIVYDLDGDGRAEVACKTADATVDGIGVVIGDAGADYRNSAGRILSGPEYLTIFDGRTGAALATTDFYPNRNSVSEWGDNYGNRCDRFLAGVAYVDGERPSLIMARGYYGPRSGYAARNEIVAYNWRQGQLRQVWYFKAGVGINNNINSDFIGQGCHSLAIADINGNGKDDIVYGSAAVADDGTKLYSTRLGHGDALHVSDMDPSRPGLEVFMPHESSGSNGGVGASFRDAATGEVLWYTTATGDVGRGVAFDVDPRFAGYEAWATNSGALYGALGEIISASRPSRVNFGVWWDGDLLRELLDGTVIDKWNWNTNGLDRLLTAYNYGVSQNNGTKANPCLVADLFGDWREEVIWRTSDNSRLLVFSTTIPTRHRLYTLMHDPVYRISVAWQNVAYNQPTHPGFFLGEGMAPPPAPKIRYGGETANAVLWQWWRGISGNPITELTGHPNFPDAADGFEYLTQLETPAGWGDSYGSRIRGYLIPPQTGDYTFWVTADDTAQVWLSPTARPEHALLIAQVPAWTDPYQWTKYASQQSVPLRLAAGHKYYIEVLHKEGVGGDHLAVAWMGPDVTPQIVDGRFLMPWQGELYGDLRRVADQWLMTDCGLPLNVDLNGDCAVDYVDFSILTHHWPTF